MLKWPKLCAYVVKKYFFKNFSKQGVRFRQAHGCMDVFRFKSHFIHHKRTIMKKYPFISFAFIAMLNLVFISCEKESPCELSGDCNEVQLINPANAENPFDEIGVQHNKGLASLRKNYQTDIDAISATSSRESEYYVFGRSAEFANSNPDLHHLLRERLRLTTADQLLGNYNFADYDKWLTVLNIDDASREVLRNSIAAVMQIEPGSVEATNDIIRAIKEQERLILAQPDLPARDFALVLMAVWRHSNHYWMDISNGEPSPNRATWWQIGLADAVCGGIGFALGGPAGGIGLGVGASKVVAGFRD